MVHTASALATGLIHTPFASMLWHFWQGSLSDYTWQVIAQFRLLIIVAGLVVGFLIGLTGVGGGILLTPVLVLLSVPPTIAVGTDLFYGSVTKLVGTYQHWKQNSIHWNWVGYMAVGSVPSAVFATYLIHYVKIHYGTAEKLVRMGLGYVLVLAAVASLLIEIYRKRLAPRAEESPLDPSDHKFRVILLGAVVGFMEIGRAHV